MLIYVKTGGIKNRQGTLGASKRRNSVPFYLK